MAGEAPTTEIEAINLMLAAIVMAPINSLVGTQTSDVAMAVRILNSSSREVQSSGYHFNSEYDWPLNVDQDDKIPLANNILRVDVNRAGFNSVDVIARGKFLYDKKTRSFTFTANLKGNVVLFLPFEDLPEAARFYIAIKASRKLQDKIIGSDTLDGYDRADELEAKVIFEEAEGDNADHSIFDTPGLAGATLRSNVMSTVRGLVRG